MNQSVEDILTPEFGITLRAAREAKLLSIKDVAARLRINHQYLAAMESGDIGALPPEPYRKAFFKEYCKILGVEIPTHAEPRKPTLFSTISALEEAAVDVVKKVSHETSDFTKDVVQTAESAVKKVGEGLKDVAEEITSKDLYKEAEIVRNERLGLLKPEREITNTISVRQRPDPIVKRPPFIVDEPKPVIRRSYTPPPAPVVAENGIERSYAPTPRDEAEYDEYHPGTSRATKVIVALLIVIAAIVGYSIFTKKSNKPEILTTENTEHPSKIVPKVQPQKEPDTVKAPEGKPADVTAEQPIAADAALVFTIKAKDSVWVSVTPDIGNGFRGKMKKGEVKSFSAKDKYFLFLGNLKALDMTLNGRTISSLPTIEGSTVVVRDVTLTRDKVFAARPNATPAPTPPQKDNVNHNVKATPQKQPINQTPLKTNLPPKPRTIRRQIPSATPILPGSD